MTRYFLAVAPPAPLLTEIDAFRGKWNHPHHRVEPHITIQPPFVWERSPEPWLRVAAEAAKTVKPFVVQLAGTGRFPRARVLYLEAKSDALADLHRAVTGALVNLIPQESGRPQPPFHPHLTLAAGRFGIDEGGLAQMEAEAVAQPFARAAFPVTHLRVYRWGQGDRAWQRWKDLPLG
jgi:2'-5' RNA ligase